MAEMPNLDPQLFAGPTLIGGIMVFFLFGIFVLQILRYIGNAPPETVWWRYPHLLVVFVFCLEVLSVVFVAQAAWDQLVIHSMTAPYLWTPPVTAPATGVLNGLVGWVVHLFFSEKVWRLATNPYEKVLAAAINVLANVGLAGSAATTYFFAKAGRKWSSGMNISIIVWLTSTVVCDVLITVSMVMLLARYKKRTSFSATKQLLRTLTRNTVENGFITTACAFVNVIVYFTRGDKDSLHMIFQYTIGRLYAIVLLTSLLRAQHTSSAPNTTRSRSGTSSNSGGAIPANSGGIPLSTRRSAHWGSQRHGTAGVQIQVQKTVQDDMSEMDMKASAIVWDESAQRGEKGSNNHLAV